MLLASIAEGISHGPRKGDAAGRGPFCLQPFPFPGTRALTVSAHNSFCGAMGTIPGAELVLIERMGHDLPPGLQSQLAASIAEFVWRAEGR
jgi:hypothetical protein